MENKEVEKYICSLEAYAEDIRNQWQRETPINGKYVENVLRNTIQFMRDNFLKEEPLLHDKGKIGDYVVWDTVFGEKEGKIVRIENGYYVIETRWRDGGQTLELPFKGYNIRLKTNK